MKIRNPILPMLIAQRRSPWLHALAICAVASLPWAYAMQQQAERADRLLAEVQSRQPRVEWMAMRYTNGKRQDITIVEDR